MVEYNNRKTIAEFVQEITQGKKVMIPTGEFNLLEYSKSLERNSNNGNNYNHRRYGKCRGIRGSTENS